MDNADNIALLEQYLRGELTGEDIAIVEYRLETDKTFAAQWAELKALEQGFRYARLGNILGEIEAWETIEEKLISGFEQEVSGSIRLEKNREMLAEIEGFEEEVVVPKLDGGKPEKPRIGRYWWSVAAGVLLLIGALFFIFQKEEKLTNEELFAIYFEPYPSNMVKRSGGGMDSLMLGYAAYEAEDYETAIQIFERQTDTLSKFFLGISYLSNGNVAGAKKELEKFRMSSNILKDKTNWYLALTYLRTGNNTRAKSILTKLSNGESSINSKANEIINIIEK